tara:strand:+ start:5268 stop:6041 length:774 start_codon:yes stop_codon:yes gene_type:complete
LISLPFAAELASFIDRPHDAVEGALIVASIIDKDADIGWARQELDRLTAEIGPGHASHICDELRRSGFQGAGRDYYDVSNSRLDVVLRSKRGIPISLAMVIAGVAHRLELPTEGINFPRHFLITVADELVDPFELKVTSIEALRAWLTDNNLDPEQGFAVASPIDIVVRMLNNVRSIMQSSGDYIRALEVSDYQLMLVPEHYGLYIERADVWMHFGDRDMVLRELNSALEHAPSIAIADRIRDRIKDIGRVPSSDMN